MKQKKKKKKRREKTNKQKTALVTYLCKTRLAVILLL